MVRRSKVARIRSVSRKRPPLAGKKTGPIKQDLPGGFKPCENALPGDFAKYAFISKIK